MKALVILILGFIAACNAELDPRCAWGQSYWCSALDVAKSCGAISHCKTTVWKNQLLKQDGGDSCLFCRTVVDDVKRYIQHGKTEAEISHFLASACGIIPNSVKAAKCKEIAESLISELVQLVTSDVEPQMICSLLGVCGGLEDSASHPLVVEPSSAAKPLQSAALTSAKRKVLPVDDVKADPLCDDCKKFFKDIQDMITSNKTEEEVEQVINQVVCSQLGSLESDCKTLVHAYLPELMDMMSKYYDPALICQSLGACTGDKSEIKYKLLFTRLRKLAAYKSTSEQNSESTCLICKTIMTELQSLDRDKAIQDEIKDLIKSQFCARMGSLQAPCELVLEQYSTELFEVLATVLEPSTRCRSLGFCDAVASDTMKPQKIMPALPLTAAKYPNSATSSADPSTECILCEYAVREIQQMISANATEEQIMEALEKGCTYLPESYVAACKQFVDSYGRTVIDMLINKIDPEKVCTELGLCGKSTGVLEKVMPLLKAASAAKAGGTSDPSPMCMVCEMVITEVKQLIGDNATEAEILQALEKACQKLPDKYKQKCKDFVDTYGRAVIDLLIHEFDPEKVCTLLGLCATSPNAIDSGKALPPIKVSYPNAGNGEACAVCETVIQYLEALLEQGSTMEQIEALLSKLCAYIPPSMVHQCEALVKQYGDLIIHYVSTLAPPKEVCSLIGVCKDKVSAAVSGVNRGARAAGDGPSIELEERVEPKLEYVRKVPLLGVDECTWGPNHICSSKEIAEKCKMLEHCQRTGALPREDSGN